MLVKGMVLLLLVLVLAKYLAQLLAIAVIDDIGAITIIALFYSGDLKLDMLMAAGFTLLVLALIGRARFGSRRAARNWAITVAPSGRRV